MAADRHWLGNDGGNEGDFGTAANWAENAVPVSTDTLWFDGNSAYNLTGEDKNAIDLAAIHITPDFVYNIGASSNPLVIDADEVHMAGKGTECWLQGEFLRFMAAPRTRGANACQIKFDTGKIPTLVVSHGYVQITSGSVFDAGANLIIQSESGSPGGGPTLIIPTGNTINDPTRLFVRAGTIECSDAVDEVQLDAGVLVWKTATLDELLQAGGHFRHSSGTVTLSHVRGGLFDAARNAYAKTGGTIHAYTGATINFRNRAGVGKPTALYTYGTPKLIFDDGQSLTVN